MRARWRTLALFFAVLGPGLISASVDNDAAGIAVYSIAGAEFGYRLLWTLIPALIALIVVQEMAARMGVVTGKGLGDLIRENFGLRISFWLMFGLIFANLATTMAEFAGIASACEILGLTRYIAVPLGAAFVWWLVVKNAYRPVERAFLVASLIYVLYIISGIRADPDWSVVLHGALAPSLRLRGDELAMVIALVGTTVSPWMQFYLQSTIVDKGIKVENYSLSRIDVIGGSFVTLLVAFFIVVTCATMIAGVRIATAGDAAAALQPVAGQFASTVFAFGLLNASLLAASILPLATAYTVCEGLGWERGVSWRFGQAPHFYGLYTGLILVGAGSILAVPAGWLIQIMKWSQVINGILLPVVLVFVLVLINRESLMGEYRNSRTFNVIAGAIVVVMAALSLLLAGDSLFPGVFG
ncbi:Mn transporter [candidate division KD3-62 bacterium DG_56]|uniref:Mn transporter n=1 Tax=candidate division KD3-62 bacterium DG_56 TaxID=1704032 RepID=A0A0S7XP39_9BACT|nr:MAG: Mn transporter [candidate division KD3-62 bacterium DG_56]